MSAEKDALVFVLKHLTGVHTPELSVEAQKHLDAVEGVAKAAVAVAEAVKEVEAVHEPTPPPVPQE